LLPKLDGISLCQHIRSHGYTMPILLLTSRDSNHDRAVGLDAGADDYVVKPFDPEELSARIRALLRRGNDSNLPILTWEHLTLDPRNCEVKYDRQILTLTPKEYALLELFLRHNRRVFSCGSILEHLWTYEDTPSEEAVRTHIKGLRQKLKAVGAPPNLIETVYGIGYRLKPLTHSSTPTTNTQSNTPQLLLDIWYRHRDQMIERVANIEQVISELKTQSLSQETRLQAWQSAHTLAGALGTFGLPLGSAAAKKIELLLEGHLDITAADLPQLQAGVDKLYREIDSKVDENIVTPLTTTANESTNLAKILAIVQETTLSSSLRLARTDKFEIEIVTELSNSQLAQPPSVILIDLDCFPQIADGFTALDELERDYPTIPIIVLSQPNGSLDLRIEVARRGGRLFISKPVTVSQILLAVDRVTYAARTSQAKVLIVDDDRAMLEGLAALLSPCGMTVTTLAEPSKFWETLEACIPDLLILDLDMPTHNGIELCQAVRTDPRWATLPIMFLTGHTAELAIDRVFAAGADDFATKPIFGTALIARIINRLERSGLQRWLAPGPTVAEPATSLSSNRS
jgi:DNA-binding response OmpR family regulator